MLVLYQNCKHGELTLFDKLYNTNQIKDDDVVLGESSSKKYGLQCYSLYAPRELRKMVYSITHGWRNSLW